jgi:hypothetical protein
LYAFGDTTLQVPPVVTVSQGLTDLLQDLFISQGSGYRSWSQMKSLRELTDTSDTGWEVVRELLPKATNKVELLPRDSARANKAVYESQMAIQTTLGAVEYMTGGILIDGGWIRIIGSGSPRLPRSLSAWNKGKSVAGYGHEAGFYLVADDVLGGFFALNWGALGSQDRGKVFYLAPGDLQWESTGYGCGEFLEFCFSGNLGEFYKGQRWKHWYEQVDTLSGNRAFYILPRRADPAAGISLQSLYHNRTVCLAAVLTTA